MLLSEFDYHLPPELVAQIPLLERDQSRLLVVHRRTGQLEHRYFYDLPEILDPQTTLVRNNTKVFKARLFGFFMPKEQNLSEVFLLEKVGLNIWRCLTHPGRKFYPGKVITFTPLQDKNASQPEPLQARVNSIKDDGCRILEFNQAVEPLLDVYGHVPLPPYIKTESDLERYQTVYAKETGSVAAPTAGLHFTPAVFTSLEAKKIEVAEVTLHVGQGTFQPVKTDAIEEHVMHHELFSLTKETAEQLNQAKETGKKILAVGTTTTRVLEACASVERTDHAVSLQPQSGYTNLFIYPGYKFKFVDVLLTNFHLPKSTLLMLVCAFASKELTMQAYEEAIREKYRFYSFGDAMLII